MPPSQSKRDAICEDVATVLAAVTANGTYWTTPARVDRYLTPWESLPDDDFPYLAVTIGDQEHTQLPSDKKRDVLPVVIWGVVKAEDTDTGRGNLQRDMNRLAQDVVTAVEADQKRSTNADFGIVERIEGDQGVFTPYAVFKAHLEVHYKRAIGGL